MTLLSSPSPTAGRAAGWLGVVGSRESFERLQGPDDGGHWWCLPGIAEAGSLVAMYCTAQASKPHQGVFAVFRIVGFDPQRDTDCKRYGSSSGYGATAFTKLALVQRVAPSLSSKTLRTDPLLGAMQCVRRSFQGTFFALEARELKRLIRLAEAIQPAA